jgi:hypothetical protein
MKYECPDVALDRARAGTSWLDTSSVQLQPVGHLRHTKLLLVRQMVSVGNVVATEPSYRARCSAHPCSADPMCTPNNKHLDVMKTVQILVRGCGSL